MFAVTIDVFSNCFGNGVANGAGETGKFIGDAASTCPWPAQAFDAMSLCWCVVVACDNFESVCAEPFFESLDRSVLPDRLPARNATKSATIACVDAGNRV
jgi:hypothetical protein